MNKTNVLELNLSAEYNPCEEKNTEFKQIELAYENRKGLVGAALDRKTSAMASRLSRDKPETQFYRRCEAKALPTSPKKHFLSYFLLLWTKSEKIEANYQDFFNVYIHAMQDTISPIDSLLLYQLSASCPFTEGLVVYQARALYQSVYRTGEVFMDLCPGETLDKNFIYNESNETEKLTNIAFYPNPANKEVFIISAFDNIDTKLQVMDMSGKKVVVPYQHINSKTISLNVEFLEKGIYLVELNNSINNETYIQKISVQH